jgi:predicted metalloprotease with PDZ domain
MGAVRTITTAIFGAIGSLLLGGMAAQQPPELNVVLKPHASGGNVDYVDVRLQVQAPEAKPGTAFLRLPMVFASVETARYDAADISVTDQLGPVPLVQKDDPVDASNFLYFRRWEVARPTVGDVGVSYRAPARTYRPQLGSGPPFDLRPEAGGVNGAGVSFMALPDNSTPYRIHLRWDLTQMPAGSRGAWSLGEGEVRTVGPVDLLAHAYYMAGPMRSYPTGDGPFAIYWLGEPPFDAQAVAVWTQKAHAAISGFFGEPGKPYRVFFRKNPYPGAGGAGLINSFMSGFSDTPAPTAESMRGHLAHEIVHNWPGSLSGPNGIVSWYGEGMAEYYDPVLTWRAGLITTDEFLTDLNQRAQSYYGNPMNAAPASEIAAKFWSDTRVRKLPYDRGSFYLATVDAQIRAKSGGERKLDDLTFAMLDRKKRGLSYDTAAWLELVTAELGPQSKTEFEDMMAGKLIVPPSNAFGACFKRETARYRHFDLGFDSASLTMTPRNVRGLKPDSTAAAAGVREGDEITTAVVLDAIQGDADAKLTLHLRRSGKSFDVTYLPRGKAVEGYRWSRVANVPDAACGI